MKKLSLLAALMILCLGLFAVDPAGAKDIVPPPVYDVPTPYNLEAAIVNINDVYLCWANPVYTDVPLGFRVYCNGNLVRYLPGENVSDCTLECVCNGCHEFYVTAYFDSQSETPPSNIVILMITANDDNIAANQSVTMKAYPNPFRSGVNLSLTNVKAGSDTRMTVYNLKGQVVATEYLRGKASWKWDGKDGNGQRVPAGTYFAKASTGPQSVLVKLTLAP